MLKKNKQLNLNQSIVIILGFAFFLVLLLHAPSIKENSAQQEKENSEAISYLSVRLKIPVLNIDAPVDQVGLASDGTMDIPSGPANTAWYKLGPRPGEVGSAVIDGHSGWKNSQPAVFDSLYKLHEGDKIYVEDNKGVITTFVVRESRKYNPSADARDVFFSNDGKSHLNLITCTGIWNNIMKTHSDRLVVFADKIIGLNP